MNVVIAIDSFKGSMTSSEAGQAAREGILRVYPDADVKVFSIADGGEGTVETLTAGMGGELISVKVKNPLMEDMEATYGILNGTTALIEMSAAAGITLVPKENLNPMHASTYGVGQMIGDAIARGCRDFVIGIGGSATNDGGVGMLQALGFAVRNADGEPVSFGAKGLRDIAEIDGSNALELLKECSFRVACDVNNPLYGDRGCSRIFAPQKGATEAQVVLMDQWMRHYSEVASKTIPGADPDFPGAGAAGGLGFAFLTFLGASLRPGIDLILQLIQLEDSIKTADIVITGEGKMDAQTVMGKAPVGVARLAKRYNIPVFAFAGAVLRDAGACNQAGIDAFFPIVRTPCTLEYAMAREHAVEHMKDTVEQVMRVFRRGK